MAVDGFHWSRNSLLTKSLNALNGRGTFSPGYTPRDKREQCVSQQCGIWRLLHEIKKFFTHAKAYIYPDDLAD